MPPKTITPKVEALEALDTPFPTSDVFVVKSDEMKLELSEFFLPLLRAPMPPGKRLAPGT